MKDFITATNQRFLQGMDRHLYLQQKEIEVIYICRAYIISS